MCVWGGGGGGGGEVGGEVGTAVRLIPSTDHISEQNFTVT